MSFMSTFESGDNYSATMSPSVSQQQSSQQSKIYIQTGKVKNQHLSLAQMRGVIQIFNHYFPKNVKKRMTKDEKQKRWNSYKNKIYQEYRRIITGQFASEKALVKRYTDPLSFLKYKLKRATNLNVQELSQTDREYFHEIGGVDDIQQLLQNTYNIDSVAKLSDNYPPVQQQRTSCKRRKISNAGSFNIYRANHNHNNNNNFNVNNDNEQMGEADHDLDLEESADFQALQQQPQMSLQEDLLRYPPDVVNLSRPVSVKNENINNALSVLNDKLDIFEREQLEKKKIEMLEMTKQKLHAMKTAFETQMNEDPHLIGSVPGVENQESVAFHCWINKHKQFILQDDAIRGDINCFIEQIIELQSDMTEWNIFLAKWKLTRILHSDNFNIVWTKVKEHLNLERHVQANANENEEHDQPASEQNEIIV